jgi:TonB family protein
LFDQTFVNAQAQTRRPWTVALSLTPRTGLVAIALIIPIVRVTPLDAPPKVPAWLAVHRVDIGVKPETKVVAHPAKTPRPFLEPLLITAPRTVPTQINPAPDAPAMDSAAATFSSSGPSLIALMPGLTTQPPAALQQPPVVKQPPTPPPPTRIGGDVQAAKLIFGPRPAYPALGKAVRAQGTVRIQALIGRDGVIRNLQLLSGPPLLVKAAMDAVAQWRYQPTLLNSQAVEVITEIAVTFTLTQ